MNKRQRKKLLLEGVKNPTAAQLVRHIKYRWPVGWFACRLPCCPPEVRVVHKLLK